MHPTCRLTCYPWKIRIPWKAPDPLVQRKLAKDKNYEEKPRYTGKPPPTAVAKALLKRPLGRPSVKSRVVDLRITHSTDALQDFNIHRSNDLSTGLESRENMSSVACNSTATHMLTIPIRKEGTRSRIENLHAEMVKYDKSIEEMLIAPAKACVEFVPLRLLATDAFSVQFLEAAVMGLVQERCRDIPALKIRILGLKSFQQGRVLFAALTAELGMRIVYKMQRDILWEIEKRRRALRARGVNGRSPGLDSVHKRSGDVESGVHPCWNHIQPVINPFDHFQPHIRVAQADSAKEPSNRSLLATTVPFPAYASFVNEFFGDEHVKELELRTVTNHEVSLNTVGTSQLGINIGRKTSTDWLDHNTLGGVPADLIARSEGKMHAWVDRGLPHAMN